jgi:hypothetical protein
MYVKPGIVELAVELEIGGTSKLSPILNKFLCKVDI